MGVVIPFKPREKNIPQYNEEDFEDEYEKIFWIELTIAMLEEQIEIKKMKSNAFDKNAMQEIDNLRKQIVLLEKDKVNVMRDLMLSKENE